MRANEFIEQQFNEWLNDLQRTLNFALLCFVGDILGDVDDLDFGQDPELSDSIRRYHALLDD